MQKKSNKYKNFDIERFLNDYDIEFKESGKNIGRGWWGIRDCPFCGDSHYHLGINLTSKKVSCFVCGESAMIPRFVKEILNLTEWSEVIAIVRNYHDGDLYYDPRQTGNKIIWPTDIINIDNIGMQYLQARNFGIDTVEKYRLKQTSHRSILRYEDHKSDFRWRILIPIIMNRKVVAYTARDYTEQQSPKYQHPILEAAIRSTASCIYNYDSLPEYGTGIFVEGTTDVWRWGKQTAAFMGVTFTKKQLKDIAEKHLKKAVIAFDENAMDKARKLGRSLIGIVDQIKVANIGKGDPAELDPFEAIKIKHQLLNC